MNTQNILLNPSVEIKGTTIELLDRSGFVASSAEPLFEPFNVDIILKNKFMQMKEYFC